MNRWNDTPEPETPGKWMSLKKFNTLIKLIAGDNCSGDNLDDILDLLLSAQTWRIKTKYVKDGKEND